MTNGRRTLLLEILGVILIAGSCVVFPGTSGSDYTGTNAGSLFGGLLGAIVMLIGLAPYMRGGGGGLGGR